MSRQNDVVDYKRDFRPYFMDVYGENLSGWFSNKKHIPGVIRRFFDIAAYGCVIENSKSSRVPFSENNPQRLILYGLIVAHYCVLRSRGSGMTGQLSSGSQGSVSASMSPVTLGSNYSDWGQTQYGIDFWRLTLPYRSFIYVSPIRNNWK